MLAAGMVTVVQLAERIGINSCIILIVFQRNSDLSMCALCVRVF